MHSILDMVHVGVQARGELRRFFSFPWVGQWEILVKHYQNTQKAERGWGADRNKFTDLWISRLEKSSRLCSDFLHVSRDV